MGTNLALAEGRALPPLLFVTSRAALVAKLGAAAGKLVDDLSAQAATLAGIPAGASVAAVRKVIRAELANHPAAEGVVIVGGYDIVAADRIDTLPASVAAEVERDLDPDHFIVWSDAGYGDRDGDQLPELPTSRVPDGGAVRFLRKVLQAAAHDATSRAGIRNVHRPYADAVFEQLGGTGVLLRSEKTTSRSKPAYELDASAIYLVLHGEPDDGLRSWGEDASGGFPLALERGNLPDGCAGSVILDGSCWAALIVDGRAKDGPDAAPRTAQTSRALAFLSRGANAVVGCTGSHYSPTEPPYDYNAQPLHKGFWSRITAGTAPAAALHQAKYFDFVHGIPHGAPSAVTRACELKLLHAFTCLGLGW